MVVDNCGCLVYVGDEVSVKEKSGDVLKDDKWGTEKENEFEDSVKTITGVTGTSSTSERGERLAWETTGEYVDANEMVEEVWGENVILENESAVAWGEVGGVLFDGC